MRCRAGGEASIFSPEQWDTSPSATLIARTAWLNKRTACGSALVAWKSCPAAGEVMACPLSQLSGSGLLVNPNPHQGTVLWPAPLLPPPSSATQLRVPQPQIFSVTSSPLPLPVVQFPSSLEDHVASAQHPCLRLSPSNSTTTPLLPARAVLLVFLG